MGLPKATEFNQTISVDLHYLEPSTWYLHMIDEFSRFSAAAMIRKKDDYETDETLDQHFWCSKLYFSDHEGEFIGDNFDDTCVGNLIEKFRVQHHSVHGVTILVRDTIIL